MSPNESGNPTLIAPLALIPYEDAPRVRDIEIAERLEFSRPRDIRQLIERNLPEIGRYGAVPRRAVQVTSGNNRMTEVQEYHLNEQQALLVAVLSRAPRAEDVREALITTYTAYRRGLLPSGEGLSPGQAGGIMKAVVGAAEKRIEAKFDEIINTALPRLVEAAVERDPRHVAVGYLLSIDVLKQHNVPQKGRDKLSRRVSVRIRNFCASHGFTVRKSRETDRLLYPPEAVAAWLLHEGATLIKEHIAQLNGQGVLKLVRPTKGGA